MSVYHLSLASVLTWLAVGAGAPYIIGQVVSFLAANSQKWNSLPTKVKTFAPMVFSVVISVGAQALLKNSEIMKIVAPYFTMVMIAFMNYLGSQHAYQKSLATGYLNKKDYSDIPF
jgi:hypothetical protein